MDRAEYVTYFILIQVLETYNYEDIGEISTVKNSGLQLVMHTGGRLVVTTEKAGQIRDLLNQYTIEANSGQYDYVKALAEFSSKDESALTFKKGELIAVVPKHDAYTEKVNKGFNFRLMSLSLTSGFRVGCTASRTDVTDSSLQISLKG